MKKETVAKEKNNTYLFKYTSEKGKTQAKLYKGASAFKAEKKARKADPNMRLTDIKFIE